MEKSERQKEARAHRLTGTDRAILGILKEDARQTVSEIAGRLGVSRTTVHNRIELLRDRNVIKRFTIELEGHLDTTGAPSNAFFILKLKRRICRLVFETIQGWPEIVQCWSLSGQNDMLVQVRCVDNDGIERLREKLVRHPEIVQAETLMVLSEWIKHPSDNKNPDDLESMLKGEMSAIALPEPASSVV
jgi:Lrp/AsnC family leucine-responsive transcriptional regulator